MSHRDCQSSCRALHVHGRDALGHESVGPAGGAVVHRAGLTGMETCGDAQSRRVRSRKQQSPSAQALPDLLDRAHREQLLQTYHVGFVLGLPQETRHPVAVVKKRDTLHVAGQHAYRVVGCGWEQAGYHLYRGRSPPAVLCDAQRERGRDQDRDKRHPERHRVTVESGKSGAN